MRIIHVCVGALVLFNWFLTAVAEAAPVLKVSNADELRRAIDGAIERGARIVMAGGTYAIDKPLVITPKSAGLTIEAADGATPVISGGRAITGWRKESLNGREVWAADVPGVKEGAWFFRQLWVGEERAVRARTPNRGKLFRVKESPDATDNWEVGQARFRFDGDDVPGGSLAYGTEVVLGTRWVESRLPIKSVDAAQKLVSFSRKSQWRTEVGDPYWVEGDPSFIDEPGEWALDRASGKIFYLPREGEAIEKIVAVAPTPGVAKLVELKGDPEKGEFVEDVTFRGVTFAHNEWVHPEPDPTTQPVSGGFIQAAVTLTPAVSGQGLRRVTFEDCTFRNLGTYALELGKATQNSKVSRCTFRDLGGGGIKLGDGAIAKQKELQTFGNAIEDCEIARGGQVFMSAVGIWYGQAYENRIAHNHIHDFYYSGISGGWTWGYDESLNRDNVIEKNHIHHIGSLADGEGKMLADMGAVYLLGGRKGTVIRNNVMHDVYGTRIAWGVYLDEGCCDVVVEKNVVYRTAQGAFHLHYGKENLVRNNIFAHGSDLQIYRSRQEEHVGFRFERNIVYWTNGSPLVMSSADQVKFDHNCYGGVTEAQFKVAQMNWPQWRSWKQDQNSILADPKLTDPAEDDYTVATDSPAIKLGFERFDVSDVGPRR